MAKSIELLSREELIKLIPRDYYSSIGAPYFKSKDKHSIENLFRFCSDIKVISEVLKSNDINAINHEEFLFSLSETKQKYFYELLDYQYYLRHRILQKLDTNNRVLLHMPTGTGKTKTTSHILSELINRKDNVKVIWLAHENELVDQGMAEFEFTFDVLGRKKIDVIREKNYDNLEPNMVMFMTYQKLYLYFQNKIDIEADYIVCDECHKVIAPTYQNGLQHAMGSDTKLIGLTATPGRSLEDIDENERLSRYFNYQKESINTDFMKRFSNIVTDENNVMSLFNELGILSKPKFKKIGFDNSKLDYSATEQKINNALADNHSRNQHIVRDCTILFQEGKKIMLFASNIKQANTLAMMFALNDLNTSIVHGEMSKKSQERNINNFVSNVTTLLIVVNKLTTGFDDPKIDCVYVTRMTKSPVLFNQMIGRGMRGSIMGGTKDCLVYSDLNLDLFNNVDELFDYFNDNFNGGNL